MIITENDKIMLRERLAAWFDVECRDLPWRAASDPYRIWISEIMLQQTQVKKVIPYYHRFIAAFPDIKTLAGADLAVILKVWEGLGYYSRARNLHKTAVLIVREKQGVFPASYDELSHLPGIGPYTAAAIASIAFQQQHAVVDGNVRRVLCRVFVITENPALGKGHKLVQELAETLLDKKNPGNHNQAVMELGALVCKPKNPQCDVCPIGEFCRARQTDTQQQYPVRQPSKKRPHYSIAAGIIMHGDKLLIARRPEEGMLGGLWEFPGGKQENGELLEDTIVREVREELDIHIKAGRKVASINHQYTHFTITLNIFVCKYLSGKPKTLGCTDWRWVTVNDLTHYAFPRANTKIIEKLLTGEISIKNNV